MIDVTAFWSQAVDAASQRDDALDERLRALVTAGAADQPDLRMPAASFLAFLGRRWPGGDVADFVDGIDPGELWLVAACAGGDAGALRRFDDAYLGEVAAGARRLGCTADQLDEIRQRVRIMLLATDPDGQLHLANVCARGDLRALIRLMGLRTAISLHRAGARTQLLDDDGLLDLATDATSPGDAVIAGQHRALLRAALAHAVAQLDPRHRTALRLHALDGVPLARVATLFQVDRATISRWIVAARAELLDATRRRLAAEHGVALDQLDSFLDVIRSRFEISLQRLLA